MNLDSDQETTLICNDCNDHKWVAPVAYANEQNILYNMAPCIHTTIMSTLTVLETDRKQIKHLYAP